MDESRGHVDLQTCCVCGDDAQKGNECGGIVKVGFLKLPVCGIWCCWSVLKAVTNVKEFRRLKSTKRVVGQHLLNGVLSEAADAADRGW